MNVYVREIGRALARAGMCVDIITSSDGARAIRHAALGERMRLVTVPRNTRLDHARLGLPRYDVVHSHYWQSAAPARAAAERCGARHVHTFHTYAHIKNESLAPGDAPEPDHRLRAEREIVRDVDAVIVMTDAEKAQVVERLDGSPARTHITAPGVDTRVFRPTDGRSARARLGARGRFVIVHIGRIQPLKGISLGIEALRRAGPDLSRPVTFVAAGGPSGSHGQATLRELRTAAAALPSGVELRLVGRLPHRSVPSLLGAADLAVICSHSESFCLAALEAQACGVPVVGTAVGGLPTFVAEGESGYLVPRSPDAFAARLADVLASTRRRRLMQAAAVEAAARFSWTAAASMIREVYDV
jgi:D-inositol-3-phosphate glycosyltransferase